MRIAVFHDSPIPPPSVRQLLVSLVRRGAEATYLRISRLSAVVHGTKGMNLLYGKNRVVTLDGAVVRGIGLIASTETLFKRLGILKQIELSGQPVINPPDAIMLARDKFKATQVLATSGIPTPESIVTEDIFLVAEVVRTWEKVVMKPLVGSMGYGSILVTDPDVAFMIAKVWQTHGQPILLQKYVRKEDRDIRVFVVGDEVLGAIYRKAPEHTWKTNVSQGASVSQAPITPELEEIALKSTEVLGLKYSGVDVGETESGYVVYEVNSMPNWQGFMEGTGINPAEKIAQLVISLAKK